MTTVDFEALFENHYDEISGYLGRRLHNRAIANDIAAQTFLEAVDRRATYDPDRGTPRGWLFGIAINLLHRQHRSEARRLKAYARAPTREIEDDYRDVDARIDAEAARASIWGAVASLSQADREVLLLLAWADLSYAEIAEAVGVPIGTVRSRLWRARSQIRAHLDGELGPVESLDG